MTTYLKDSTHNKSSLSNHFCYYIWNEKKEIKGLKFLKEFFLQDSILMWDNLEPITTKSKKINKCKLDKWFTHKFTHKFTTKEKIWFKMYSSNVGIIRFSEILHYKEKQAFGFVEFKCCAYDVTTTFYFFFEKENDKWKIRKVIDFFRV